MKKYDLPREKLLKYGPNRLDDVELLALILSTGYRSKGPLALARVILRQFKSDSFVKIGVEDLLEVPGVGLAKASKIVAAFELSKRLLRGKKQRLILSRQAVWREMRDLRGRKKEHFVVFYLDVRSQILERRVVSVGSLDASIVHPREVFEDAVRSNAAQIVVAHNHPSGVLEPSEADLDVTRRLVEAGEILGIELIDHVIVTDNNSLSLRRFILSYRKKFR